MTLLKIQAGSEDCLREVGLHGHISVDVARWDAAYRLHCVSLSDRRELWELILATSRGAP